MGVVLTNPEELVMTPSPLIGILLSRGRWWWGSSLCSRTLVTPTHTHTHPPTIVVYGVVWRHSLRRTEILSPTLEVYSPSGPRREDPQTRMCSNGEKPKKPKPGRSVITPVLTPQRGGQPPPKPYPRNPVPAKIIRTTVT